MSTFADNHEKDEGRNDKGCEEPRSDSTNSREAKDKPLDASKGETPRTGDKQREAQSPFADLGDLQQPEPSRCASPEALPVINDFSMLAGRKALQSYFQPPAGADAAHFLRQLSIDNLYSLVHRSLNHSSQSPAPVSQILLAQERFAEVLQKIVPAFLDTKPSIEQICEFLSIPRGFKLTPDQLKEYGLGGASEVDEAEDSHSMTAYKWTMVASYVYQRVIPTLTSIDDIRQLLEVEPFKVRKLDFSAQKFALKEALARGLILCGADTRWIDATPTLKQWIINASEIAPQSLVSEYILGDDASVKTTEERISRVVSALAGQELTARLLVAQDAPRTAGTLASEFTRFGKHEVLHEAPEKAISSTLMLHEQLLLTFLYGCQRTGSKISAPATKPEQEALRKAAAQCGYLADLRDGYVKLEPHALEIYGTKLAEIASNLRDYFRKARFESAEEFVTLFDPRCLPRIKEIPSAEAFPEWTPEMEHTSELKHVVSVVLLEELVAQLPEFHKLNPSAQDVRTLLEIPNTFRKLGFDVRYPECAGRAHHTYAFELFERYLAHAKTVRDWATIVTYRTPPSSEDEQLQAQAYNAYIWRPIEIGDPGLRWMANDVWGNSFEINQFEAKGTLQIAFQDIPDTDASDETRIARAVSLIQGGFLAQNAQERLKSSARYSLLEAIRNALRREKQEDQGQGYVEQADWKDAQARSEARVIAPLQKADLIKYLIARQSAGVEIVVPIKAIPSFERTLGALGYQLSYESTTLSDRDSTGVTIQQQPKTRGQKLTSFAMTKYREAVSQMKDFFRREVAIYRRGWR